MIYLVSGLRAMVGVVLAAGFGWIQMRLHRRRHWRKAIMGLSAGAGGDCHCANAAGAPAWPDLALRNVLFVVD